MWMTGNDAVNRYDGSMVKVYNLNKYFKDCPNLQQGYGFAEDNESNIYIGSVRGLYIYHRNTDKFSLQKIFADSVNNEAMPFACKDGKLWCFNKKYEIAAYDIHSGEVSIVTKFPLEPLRSLHIYDLEGNVFYDRWPFFDKQNNIWFIGAKGINRFNTVSKTTSAIHITTQLKEDFFINCSYYNKEDNEILLGTKKGIIIYKINTALEKYITTIGAAPIEDVQAICSNKKLLALACKKDLLIIEKQKENHLRIEKSRQKFIRYYAADFDKAGRLWICNDGLGQVVFNFSPPLLPKLPGEDIAFAEFKGTGASTFAEFENGDIAVQYNNIVNNITKQLETISFPKNFDGSLGYRTFTDKARKGIWLSTLSYNNHQLKIYFTGNNKKPVLNYIINESDSFGNLQDLKVLDDSRMLASFQSGLCWLKNNSAVKINNQPCRNPFAINKISNNKCAVSYLDNDMWLVQLTAADDIKFIQKILPGVQSFYLQEDSKRNQYWVGANKGIYLLDKNFKQVKLFDANNGLAGTYIYGLLLDEEGNAWCSHQRGLSSINAATFQIINYDKSDGIQDWDFNNRAFYKATDGTLYFGGVSGFNYFKPPLKSITYYQPEVYIDEIWVNNKTYLPDTNANFIQKLSLSFYENSIAIKAIIKDLGNANMQQLIYRIKETDTKWKYLSNNSTISFNSLSPGTYILELGTYDKYTNKEIIQKTVSISIAAPFYSKAWFWVLISILATALLFGFYNRLKINKQKNLFHQQLALEQQRNKITADLHDDIGASLSSLQLNSAVAGQLINKDVEHAKKMLNKIETQSKNLADKIGDFIWSMKPGKDEFMTMSSRIKTFANDILAATNIDYKIQIDKEVDIVIKDISTRKNVVLITKEAINNAVKYSQASTISIALNIRQNNIYLTIKDNGIGFLAAEQKGNGIANMKKRAEELKGDFNIVSAANEGATISAVIPLVP
jgi:signal transduction histidine kinase